MFSPEVVRMILWGVVETLYMTVCSTLIAYIIGMPLGIALIVTDREGLHPVTWFNTTLGIVINLLRSVPFVILVITLMPLTKRVVGTAIGPTATIVPLVVAAAPFIARVVESSLKEVDKGVVEAAQSMGATPAQVIWKVMLPEARPSLLTGAAIAITTILGYSAMAGVVGGGGLGDIAIRYGYHRYENDVMFITVALLVIVVQVFQEVGMRLAKIGDKR